MFICVYFCDSAGDFVIDSGPLAAIAVSRSWADEGAIGSSVWFHPARRSIVLPRWLAHWLGLVQWQALSSTYTGSNWTCALQSLRGALCGSLIESLGGIHGD